MTLEAETNAGRAVLNNYLFVRDEMPDLPLSKWAWGTETESFNTYEEPDGRRAFWNLKDSYVEVEDKEGNLAIFKLLYPSEGGIVPVGIGRFKMRVPRKISRGQVLDEYITAAAKEAASELWGSDAYDQQATGGKFVGVGETGFVLSVPMHGADFTELCVAFAGAYWGTVDEAVALADGIYSAALEKGESF